MAEGILTAQYEVRLVSLTVCLLLFPWFLVPSNWVARVQFQTGDGLRVDTIMGGCR